MNFQIKAQAYICENLASEHIRNSYKDDKHQEVLNMIAQIEDLTGQPSKTLNYYKVMCNISLGNTEAAILAITALFKRGKTLDYIADRDSIFAKEQKVTLDSIYEIERKEFLFNLNFDLMYKIEEMYAQDQFVRRLNELEDETQSFLIRNVDSLNRIKFYEIIDEFGFPTVIDIGPDVYGDLYTVLIHLGGAANDGEWTKLQKLLLIELQKQELDPMTYSLIHDRRSNVSKYAAMIPGSRELPVEDAINLDKIRRTIGLYSLKHQSDMYNFDIFPMGYKPDILSFDEVLELCRQ